MRDVIEMCLFAAVLILAVVIILAGMDWMLR